MRVIRRKRRGGPLITILTAVLVAAACFWLGFWAARYLGGHRPTSEALLPAFSEGTGRPEPTDR